MAKKKLKPLFEGSEWSFPLINSVYEACRVIAKEELKLDTYENQIEIISSDQMLDAYTSTGMPVMYAHWSFGKRFLQEEHGYRSGQSGLAYEIVINSSPCINYLMEENTMTMQALVIAHAAFGHNSFFKNNYMFRQWTDAEGIIDYLLFAKKKIAEYEEMYGAKEVESILDSCHALQSHGVDRYLRPSKLSKEMMKEQARQREASVQREVNDLWRTVPKEEAPDEEKDEFQLNFLPDPEENILYFLEKKAPNLESWEREVIRIVRKVAQYFYPQKQTQLMNEGWATFTHYYIMNRLWEKGQITDGSYMEFIQSHCNVITQPNFDDKWFTGFNVYHLGFKMFMDIKRICEKPDAEDYEWFPEFAGKDWLETVTHAMKNFRDESFVLQYLSPKVMRELHMFTLDDDAEDKHEYHIDSIHDEVGFKRIRKALAKQYSLSNREPDIQVVDADIRGDRLLILEHKMVDGKLLHKDIEIVLKHIGKLWGYDVFLESNGPDGETVKTYTYENNSY